MKVAKNGLKIDPFTIFQTIMGELLAVYNTRLVVLSCVEYVHKLHLSLYDFTALTKASLCRNVGILWCIDLR